MCWKGGFVCTITLKNDSEIYWREYLESEIVWAFIPFRCTISKKDKIHIKIPSEITVQYIHTPVT